MKHIHFASTFFVATLFCSCVFSAQEKSTSTASENVGTIVVDTDDTCILLVDATMQGVINPDQAKRIRVDFGQHILKCSIAGVPDLLWRKVIEVKTSKQVAALISLKALHTQYEAASHEAEEQAHQEVITEPSSQPARQTQKSLHRSPTKEIHEPAEYNAYVEAVQQQDTMTEGVLLKQVSPVYPEEARKKGIQGAVRLGVTIQKNGSVADISPISGPRNCISLQLMPSANGNTVLTCLEANRPR